MVTDKGKIKILNKIYVFVFFFHVVFAEKHDHIVVNYDFDNNNDKVLRVNETLELICKNMLNSNPPSWTYPKRLYNNPRVKFYIDIGESRMVISKAEAEDAGKYGCEIEHEYNSEIYHFNKEIEVIVNEIKKVEEVETDNNGIKLLCTVIAYPTPHVFWKIDYANETLNPPTEAPDLADDYWLPTDPRVLVDKSNGRFTLRQYNGVNNAELIITNVTEDDNGKYYCVARNLLGEQCKNCIVNRTKRGVASEGKPATLAPGDVKPVLLENKYSQEGKSATLAPGDVKPVLLETKNSQEGSGGAIIVLIALLSLSLIAVLGSVIIGTFLWRKHFNRNQLENGEENMDTHINENIQTDDENATSESTNFQDHNSRNIGIV